MANITTVFSSGGEDFVDELTSLIVYEEGQKHFKKVKEGLGLDPEESKVDEALESALTTVQFGLMNLVITTVTEYAIAKTALVLASIIAFIKGRAFIKNMINNLTNLPILKRTPLGYAGGKILVKVSNAVTGSEQQALAIGGMINNSSNNIVSSIGQERQNQIMIQGQKIKRVQSAKDNIYSVRNTSREKNMELYLHKFDTATWQNNTRDKKLYFDCVGQNADTVSFNSEYVKRLNSYANIVTTAKGEIFTNAKATLDLLTQMGARL